jgi:hypothetical protein
VSLPLNSSHDKHKVCPESAFANRLHPNIIAKIYSLVESGIILVPHVRRALRNYVDHELVKEHGVKPQSFDRRYYPTRNDVKNHVHRALVAGRYSNLDQEDLKAKIQQWSTASPSSKYFYRPCSAEETETSTTVPEHPEVGFLDDEEQLEADTDVAGNFLFVHQEPWATGITTKIW